MTKLNSFSFSFSVRIMKRVITINFTKTVR